MDNVYFSPSFSAELDWTRSCGNIAENGDVADWLTEERNCLHQIMKTAVWQGKGWGKICSDMVNQQAKSVGPNFTMEEQKSCWAALSAKYKADHIVVLKR